MHQKSIINNNYQNPLIKTQFVLGIDKSVRFVEFIINTIPEAEPLAGWRLTHCEGSIEKQAGSYMDVHFLEFTLQV